MHPFHLSIRLGDNGDLAPPNPTSAQGVSIGQSPDGSATVAILGAVGQEGAASHLAKAYVQGRRDVTRCAACDTGSAVLDHLAGTATVVAAPIGLRQIFWAIADGEFSVGSAPNELACLAGRKPALRPEALFRYLYFHMSPGPNSVYAAVSKLEGGHWLRWDGRAATVERYWRPRFENVAAFMESGAKVELHRLLNDAVHRSLAGSNKTGAFLSGGLDSSTVAGLAAQYLPGIQTVSMGFDAAGYDEMEYARLAARHFGTKPLEYYVTPDDVLATLPMIAAAFPEPFGNSSAAAAYQCARVAREHGLDLLLAGDGGDEIFGGNERYVKQLVFERYAQVPHLLRASLLEPMLQAAGNITRRFPIGKALSYVSQANVPLPDRLQSYNFLHRHDPAEVFTADLLAEVDTGAPLQLLRDEYDIPNTNSAVNRMLFLDWKFTLHDNDLVKVNTMCQLAGVDVAYPMLDPALVEFSLTLPADWKVCRGSLRWFYKRAMRGFLPDEILHKTKHGFGLPFGVWTRTHEGLRRLSEDALASLSQRNFFRPEFLEEAQRLHRDGHASYYGELVWILTTLELWMQQHSANESF